MTQNLKVPQIGQSLKTPTLHYQGFTTLPDSQILFFMRTYALSENEELKEYQFFIIDEYQDFNQAEENLIRELTTKW